jgi:hypothetical protein
MASVRTRAIRDDEATRDLISGASALHNVPESSIEAAEHCGIKTSQTEIRGGDELSVSS